MIDRCLIRLNAHRLLPVIAALIMTVASCNRITDSYDKAKTRAQEDALEAALKYTRQAIQDYRKDHGKPPHQLQDLVTYGYLNSLPIDPMTNKADWSLEFEPCNGPDPCEKLIKDVHSSSTAKSSKNNLYSEW